MSYLLLMVFGPAVVGFFIGTSPKNRLWLALITTVLVVALVALISLPLVVLFRGAGLAIFATAWIEPALLLWGGYGIGIWIKRAAQRRVR